MPSEPAQLTVAFFLSAHEAPLKLAIHQLLWLLDVLVTVPAPALLNSSLQRQRQDLGCHSWLGGGGLGGVGFEGLGVREGRVESWAGERGKGWPWP